jgi:hypothetical protein
MQIFKKQRMRDRRRRGGKRKNAMEKSDRREAVESDIKR